MSEPYKDYTTEGLKALKRDIDSHYTEEVLFGTTFASAAFWKDGINELNALIEKRELDEGNQGK